MQDTPYLLGFTAGELSPWLSSRFDLQAYQRGAALIRNFLVQPYGGLRRRAGTQYVADAAVNGEGERLFSFRFSDSDVIMLEFYPSGIRFYKNGVLLTKNNAPYVVSSHWTTVQQVLSLQCVQLNDVIFIACPTSRPCALRRYSDTDWRLSTLDFSPFPRETYVRQGTPISVSFISTYTVTLETRQNMFTRDMENMEEVLVDMELPEQTLFLNKRLDVSATSLPSLAANSTSVNTVYSERNITTSYYDYYTCIRAYKPDYFNGYTSAANYPYYFMPGVVMPSNGSPIEVCGNWELRTTGEWNASFEIWRSYDTSSYNSNFRLWRWTCIKSFRQDEYSSRKNWEITGSEKVPCRLLLVCRSSKASSIGGVLHMVIHAAKREYRFSIISYQSARSVMAAVSSTYMAGPSSFESYDWSFGAFGARNGCPKMISFYQNRLWLGGIRGLPTTLLASCVGDFYNFRMDSDDDSALHLTLASSDQSRIRWICPSRNLLVGTSESEWILSSPDGGAIRATTATFSRQSSVGSADKQADGVENTVFYVQRGGKRLREISYKLESDGFTSTDVSLLAEHLFASGIREWAVQRGGSVRLWVLMDDYSLAVLTMNMEQQINAWQRVEFHGRRVLHLETIPKAGSYDDEVWFIMQHKGNGRCTLERISSDSLFLDGLCRGALGAAPHLAGLPGYAFPSGHPEQAVPVQFGVDGSFSVPDAGATGTWCYGASYDSELQTMPMERDFSFNTIRQEGRVRLRLLESRPAFSYRASHVDRWETYDPSQDMLPDVYTGSVRVSHIPSPGVGQGFSLLVNGMDDFKLLALTVEIDYHGR